MEYRHDANAETITKPIVAKGIVCRHYLSNSCCFGSKCRFSHILSGNEIVEFYKDCISSTDGNMDFEKPKIVTSEPNEQMKNRIETLGIDSYSSSFLNHQYKLSFNDMNGALTLLRNIYQQNTKSHRTKQCKPNKTINAFCPFEPPCPLGNNCRYAFHMQQCKMCDQYCLSPINPLQRRTHHLECVKEHERAMEYSFAIARSKDKTCDICYDVVLDKCGSKKRFGILPNCNHVFCLECIRLWRKGNYYELNPKAIRSCPVCRVRSDFVCPSTFWIENKEEKDKLFNDYRTALSKIDCKYFKKGKGRCPFGKKCFYKHALGNGETAGTRLPSNCTKCQQFESDTSSSSIPYPIMSLNNTGDDNQGVDIYLRRISDSYGND